MLINLRNIAIVTLLASLIEGCSGGSAMSPLPVTQNIQPAAAQQAVAQDPGGTVTPESRLFSQCLAGLPCVTVKVKAPLLYRNAPGGYFTTQSAYAAPLQITAAKPITFVMNGALIATCPACGIAILKQTLIVGQLVSVSEIKSGSTASLAAGTYYLYEVSP